MAGLTRWLLVLVLAMVPCAGGAGAQPLPFVEPGGLVQAGLRYSHVVARLGEPPRSREAWLPGEPAMPGGIVFEYPALGLGFVVPAIERPEADPLVTHLLVRAPATARTPEGIGIGMARPAVRPLITTGHAMTEGSALVWRGGQGAGQRRVELHFGATQALELMVFDTGLPPEGVAAAWLQKARVALAGVLLLALLLALPWLFKGMLARERRRLRALAPMRRAMGAGMLVLAPILAVLGGLLASGGDGAVSLLGVLLAVSGAGLALAGGYNRVLSAGLRLRWLGAALLLSLAILAVLSAWLR